MVDDDHGPGEHGPSEHGHGAGPRRHGADQPTPTHHDAPAGLTTAANGLFLSPDETVLPAGEEREWRFRIRDELGSVVTAFEARHGARLHLIVVRRDLANFQHLHPTMAPGGTWSQPLALPEAGVYRAFVDVSVEGRSTTLGVDLFAPGGMDVDPGPEFTRTKRIDGYDVTLSPGPVGPGVESTLTFEVRDVDGVPVTLEPYLESRGHLVALREGDLAYLHVHPTGTDRDAGRVSFRTTFPTRGHYRLFLQVRPDGDLVTTWFDVRVDGSSDREG